MTDNPTPPPRSPDSNAPADPEAMWAERYSADGYFYGTEPNEFLRASASQLPTGSALCLAEGEGRNAVYLAGAGWAVSSVELTQSGVAKTLDLAKARGVTVHASVGDLAAFDIGIERWDLVVSIFAHMAPAVRADLHRRVVSSLRPGGVFLVEAYTPAQLGRGTGGPSSAEMMMTLDALREELAPLDFTHGRELERVVIEGNGHTGAGAVVQVLARKAN